MAAENQQTLIKLLRKVIAKYNKKLEELDTINNSTLSKNKQQIEAFREDFDKILELDLKVVESILDETDTPALEKDSIYQYISSIKALLQLNKEKKTTFVINDSQKEYIKQFFKKVDELVIKNGIAQQNNLENIGRLSNIVNKYKQLLGLLEDSNNTEFISDIDLLTLLFKETKIDAKEKRKIVIDLMRLNQEIFNRNMQSDNMVVHMSRLNIEDVKTIFNKYGYDFTKLSAEQQEYILAYGDARKIEEMFDCFKKFNFPKFDEVKDGKKLALLLISGEKNVFTNIVSFSLQKGLRPNDLTKILPALIPQTKPSRDTHVKRGPYSPRKPKNDVQAINGKSDDYVKNVAFFERIGFKIDYIYSKCKEILVMNHQRLMNNIDAFLEYGFTFDKAPDGSLFLPALTALMSNHFAEIADQFIEICPEGHRYIRENMSKLNVVVSPEDISFYNIYASYMTQDSDGLSLAPEGPFVNNNSTRLRLRGEITRVTGNAYEFIPYRGIEEHNKKEKTMTIDIQLQKNDNFDEAVNSANEDPTQIVNLLRTDKTLSSLDKYIDPTDGIRYNFDGVLISKPKVKRIYNILKNYGLETLDDALLYAVTYNSIINEDDFNKIQSIIQGRRVKQ